MLCLFVVLIATPVGADWEYVSDYCHEQTAGYEVNVYCDMIAYH